MLAPLEGHVRALAELEIPKFGRKSPAAKAALKVCRTGGLFFEAQLDAEQSDDEGDGSGDEELSGNEQPGPVSESAAMLAAPATTEARSKLSVEETSS